ncbi:recombination mediator RecR [Tistrella mobilis]|uniref:Recombination protein RecR n=1 Tax=Tistrella mobilis (strain KA081020-065) TaxID=1110502 RepID=I3TP43_TISMK|nr:recombination mediator RecR [Tistrella mobilis]AFK54531.1 Recombinational DNA repair protein (RecF pathway) [Tistrella mobilis KA081020-065]
MAAPEIEKLVTLLARLPGLGPRSARRAALTLLRRREALMLPLADALAKAAAEVKSCTICGNLDARDPCGVCADERRDPAQLCVVEQVADLWAMERAGAFRGRYHVLGGTLSALDGIGPDELGIPKLAARVAEGGVTEVVMALPATVDGQTTAHYIADRLAEAAPEANITRLAHGMPVGGALDYMDDGTIQAALKARRPV